MSEANKPRSKGQNKSAFPKSVWMLVSEDISECEAEYTLWSTKAKAQEAMEKEILEMKQYAGDDELERESDVKVRLGKFWWSIRERKIEG